MNDQEAKAWLQSHVSRETWGRLLIYESMLKKWQGTINLVSQATLPMLWSRHFLDSYQVLALCPVDRGCWLDLGSGGGFPGLVCAMAAQEEALASHSHLLKATSGNAVFSERSRAKPAFQSKS